MEKDTHIALEEAVTAIMCSHPELAGSTSIVPDFYLDKSYRAVFESIREEGRFDPVKITSSASEAVMNRLENYLSDDTEFWERYEDFFRDYEKQLTDDYVDRSHDELISKLKRHEIGYTEFCDEYEKMNSLTPKDEGPLDMSLMRRRKKSVRKPIEIPGMPQLSDVLKLGTTDFMTIGGGPGKGKSAFLMNLAEKFSRSPNNRILYYNIEMDVTSATNRLLCCAASGKLKLEDCQKKVAPDCYIDIVEDQMTDISSRQNFYFSDYMTDIDEVLSDILKKIDREHRCIVIIDYLGLLTTAREVIGFTALEDIVKRLRVFALRHRVLIIAASQLTRESTSNGTENIYSFASSSEVERSSTHAVVLREPHESKAYSEMQLAAQHRQVRLVDFDIVKNRNGACRKLQYEFDLECQYFRLLTD